MIGWKFPETGWGLENGKNDPGIETFRGNPYPSLAREPIQNSLDAKREGTNLPVIVEFKTIKVPSNTFPKKNDFIKVLELCIKEAGNNEETVKEYKKALETLNKEEITFLKISDYNTTGLSGSDQLRKTDWHRLIKTVGDSNKESTSGGSYGIGKHAPFACSNLKTVFYSTLDTEGKKAFQGVSKLITHLDENGIPRQGTGFFGEIEFIQPLKDLNKISSIFNRNKIGTDVFVAGFQDNDNWESEIIKSVLENFFVAIYEGLLEVLVGDKHLKSENIHVFLEDYIKNDTDFNAEKYFEALTSNDSKIFIEKDFEGLGEIKLFLLNKNYFHKKIAMVRRNGMLIKAKQNYSTPIKYAGVLLIKGDEFNKLLKKMENPSHTDWEVNRHPNPRLAKNLIKKLYSWMNQKIKELSSVNDSEEFNVEELGQFLPDDIDISELLNENRELEGDKGKPREIKLIMVNNNKPAEEYLAGYGEVGVSLEGGGTILGNEYEDNTQRDSRDPENVIDLDLGKGLNPNQNRNPSPKPNIKPEDGENLGGKSRVNSGSKTTNSRNKIKIIRQKVFCSNPDEGIYQIRLTSINSGYVILKVNVSGEEDNEPAEIENAINQENKETISVNRNVIGPITLNEGKNSIQFKLKQAMRVALEVSINEG